MLFYRTPANSKPAEATAFEIFLQMDLIGTFVGMAALICYILALQWGGVTKSWNSADVIGTLIGWILLTIVFVCIQWWQGERALLVPRILSNRTVLASCIFIFL